MVSSSNPNTTTILNNDKSTPNTPDITTSTVKTTNYTTNPTSSYHYDIKSAKSLFGSTDLGPIIYGDIKSVVFNGKHRGTLYIGSKSLCFHGYFFFVERKVILPYLDICHLSLHRNNAILIKIMDDFFRTREFAFDFFGDGGGEESKSNGSSNGSLDGVEEVLHLFMDLRERALNGFVSDGVNNDASNDDEVNTTGTTTLEEDSLSMKQEEEQRKDRRMSLIFAPHPLMSRSQSSPVDFQHYAANKQRDYGEKESTKSPSPREISHAGEAEKSREEALALISAIADFRSFRVVVQQRNQIHELRNQQEQKDEDTILKIEEEIDEENYHQPHTTEDIEEEEETKEEVAFNVPKDLAKAWKDVKESKTPTFKEIAFQNMSLPCDLDTFYNQFIADDAPHSMENYQEEHIGDSELDTTSWKLDREDGFTKLRTINYRHPVNAPMAPPSALATKKQQCQRFGPHGLLIKTTTEVKDVPMTDCFYVEDVIFVEPSSSTAKNNKNEILVSAKFELRFVKSTMFRRIIEKTTKGEILKWFKGYNDMLGRVVPTLMETTTTVLAEEEEGEIVTSSSSEQQHFQQQQQEMVTVQQEQKPTMNTNTAVSKVETPNLFRVIVAPIIAFLLFGGLTTTLFLIHHRITSLCDTIDNLQKSLLTIQTENQIMWNRMENTHFGLMKQECLPELETNIVDNSLHGGDTQDEARFAAVEALVSADAAIANKDDDGHCSSHS